ncbi:MAG TPA: DNA gyrase subunit A [Bacteroidia bacterium]|nr:DNA gyrase subunit A [Bacteroidia bacterium]QQR94306.1 MAG: DNA gyrase subunit A [Bacteroidota bacterium]MBP7714601.1 DNA gyrase subunit A [Bacteroidia bacterium]MBP8667872.1 DNA gyrase subunit A [Bacteroidia bacterium]HOZ82498.1 DNA gyrase subunit A [Bacteroidia bacterium]
MSEGEKIVRINIEEEMKTAYIDYSMSVIVSRALPDVRDGFKPVHRRVLYGMLDLGVLSNRPYKKSARIVGEVLGKYHPHGDASVYDTMVRMAQEWSLRYPLVDGQGNFGSIDGDSPAAMRYTEARLKKIAEEMLADIDKDTVDFKLNFDDTLQEPTVLPAKIPNLLVNGAAGIAVGMATNMPPHNLTEVCNAVIAYIDNRDITVEEMLQFVKAPDFPTGGIIYGYSGVKEALLTGRGRVVMRAKANIETLDNGRERIIVTEIPYMINKAEMIKKTADLVNDKKIEGITDIRDESGRDGMRIVYEIKRDAMASVVLNNLYKHTPLQTSFGVNNIALVNGRPLLLNLKDLIHYYVEHRHDVLVRKTKFELAEAEKRAHILEGLLIALDHLDEVIALIRASQTPDEARTGLIEKFALSEIQAKAILDMRLQRLTGLERDKIKEEYAELMKLIDYLKKVLGSEELRMLLLKKEVAEILEKYGDERRTEIVYAADDISMEDMIEDEAVVVTISHMGYIKRTPLTEYRTQNRGGRGSIGSSTRDEDFVEHLFVATNHNYILLFTQKGRCFWLKTYEIPEGNKQFKGRAIQNLISIEPDDKVFAFINVKTLEDEEYINNNYIVMCTRQGVIKKTPLEAYSRVRQNGINAIVINDGDELIEAKLTNGNNEILLAVKSGRAIRFNENTVRTVGRNSIGVRGVSLDHAKDEVIGMVCIKNATEETILVVSEKGYGKRSDLEDYRVTNRGGKGVKTMNITEKTGDLIAIKSVKEDDDLMIINKSGITIRMEVKDLRVMGRNTQGVKLIRLDDDDSIASVAKIDMEITGNGNQKENGNDTEENPTIENGEQNNNQTEENNNPE